MWDQSNADGSALYLGLKLDKNIQGFYVGNSHLTNMLCPYNHMETFLAHIMFLLWSFIALLKIGKELQLTLALLELNNFEAYALLGNVSPIGLRMFTGI